MANTLFGIPIASRDEPLANVKSLRLWLPRLPRNDPIGAAEAIVGLLQAAGASPPEVDLHRLRAVMELDRIAVPLQAQLRAQYRMPALSEEVRQRLWRACDDLAHWFAHVYEKIYESFRARGGSHKVRAELHGIFARMFFYVGVQTRQALFRYEDWIPGKWRLLHSAYREACEQAVVAEPFALDELTPPAERLSPEQEYLQILLLQRINNGNLTAQQIDWAADWLRGWAHLLRLAMTPPERDGFWLDLGQGAGLVPRRPEKPAGELLYLDMEPLREPLGTLLSRFSAQAAANPDQGGFNEQLALARRLDQLWLVRMPEQPRRGERRVVHENVTVVVGWAEIVVALAAKVAQKAGAPHGYHYDDYGRLRPDKEGIRGMGNSRKADADGWQIYDTSDSGSCVRSASRLAARQRPGVLLALQVEGQTAWELAIVRRLKKLSAQQTELGIEIIARNAALITVREPDVRESGYSVDGVDVGLGGKSFRALYLPPYRRGDATSPPGLVVPPSEFTVGRRLSFLADAHSWHVCLAAPLERTNDWVWSALEIVG